MPTFVQDPPWIARIEQMERRSNELGELMNKPEVAASGALIVKFAKEHGALEKILRPFRDYRSVTQQVEESHAIVSDPAGDADLKQLAEAELPELEARRESLLNQLKEKLVTGDEAAISSIILEVRAGTGGDEAALFAGELLNMYSSYAARKGFKTELMSMSDSELGGIKEAIINITGEEVYLHYRFEAGGHRVQRVPKTEAQGRIHTSAATVAVLPEPEEVEIDIDWEKDVIEHVSRAGGPGGQNVNKVSSAIKLEHIATGITVSMRDEKSQHKNRAKARRVLMSRVYEHFQSQQRAKIESARRSMVGSGDRSDRIRTYNYPQNRVTDHRVGKDVFDIPGVLAGKLDDFIAELADRELQLRLEALV
ncbi:Peptide chain release factor RF1 [Phycisphaerae bacterium RAS1]|nr:Peptide chain release factor RF1 [Phycisphaerae bacterium RAS1]